MIQILKNKYFIFLLVLGLALFCYLLGFYLLDGFREGMTPPDLDLLEPSLDDPPPFVLPGKFLFNDMFDFDLNNQLVKLKQFFFG